MQQTCAELSTEKINQGLSHEEVFVTNFHGKGCVTHSEKREGFFLRGFFRMTEFEEIFYELSTALKFMNFRENDTRKFFGH